MESRNTLGHCRQCHGPLGTYGAQVRCTVCKLPLSPQESAGLLQAFAPPRQAPTAPADVPVKAPVPMPASQAAVAVPLDKHASVPEPQANPARKKR